MARFGHIIDFFPKFHCELAPVEKVWAIVKQELRATCKYSFRDLQERLPQVIDSIPITFYYRIFRSCSRYILAYGDQTLTPEQVRIQHLVFYSVESHGKLVSTTLFRSAHVRRSAVCFDMFWVSCCPPKAHVLWKRRKNTFVTINRSMATARARIGKRIA